MTQFFFILSMIVLLAGCSQGAVTSSSEADEDVIPEINVNCGDSSCISNPDGTTLFSLSGLNASENNDNSALETMILFYWMLTGFPDENGADYQSTFTSDIQRQIIPQSGLVGKLSGIKDRINVLSSDQGIGACEEAPTSGTVSGLEGETISWETPEQTVPASFPQAGTAYDKRIRYQLADATNNLDYDITFEVLCGYDGFFAIYKVSRDGEEQVRAGLFYDRGESDKLYMDIYFKSTGMMNSTPLVVASLLRLDGNDFQEWVTRSGWADEEETRVSAYRYAVHADYTDLTNISMGQIEAGTGGDEADGIELDDFNGRATASKADWSGGVALSGAGSTLGTGCANSWFQNKNEITSSATCTGLDLLDAPTPVFGGDMSMKSIQDRQFDWLDSL